MLETAVFWGRDVVITHRLSPVRGALSSLQNGWWCLSLKSSALDRLSQAAPNTYMLGGKHARLEMVDSVDRIAVILNGHLDLAEKQMQWMKQGVEFAFNEGDGTAFIPVTKDVLAKRIESLKSALQRHKNLHA